MEVYIYKKSYITKDMTFLMQKAVKRKSNFNNILVGYINIQ